MAKTKTIADQIRAYALANRCFSLAEVSEHFKNPSSHLSVLVADGYLDNPARGIYCVGGISIEDPQLKSLIKKTGSKVYSPEVRLKKSTAIERAAAKRIKQAMKRDEPRKKLLSWTKKKKIFSVPEAKAALGARLATLATGIAQKGQELVVVQPGIYAIPSVAGDEEALAAYFTKRSETERQIVSEIDEYRSRFEQMPHLGTGGVTVNYWDDGKPATANHPAVKARFLRVYVNIPGHPSIFGQATRGKGIVWKGKAKRGQEGYISDAAAAMLASKVFDPLPTLFADLMKLVTDPDYQPKERRRTGGYTDFRSHDDENHKMFRCAYTYRDVRTLDASKLTHPLPSTVQLFVDHREPDVILTALKRVPNLDVIRTELEHGDYLVPDQMIFERKTTADLFASLTGGQRLVQQACAVHQLGLKTTLIVEGGIWADRRINLNQLYSRLSWLRYDKAHDIVETADERFTVYAIVQAIKHYIFGLSSEPRQPDQNKKRVASEDPRAQKIFALRSLATGISEKRANALLDHFGSIHAIANGSIEELLEISGIGQSLAETVYKVFR